MRPTAKSAPAAAHLARRIKPGFDRIGVATTADRRSDLYDPRRRSVARCALWAGLARRLAWNREPHSRARASFGRVRSTDRAGSFHQSRRVSGNVSGNNDWITGSGLVHVLELGFACAGRTNSNATKTMPPPTKAHANPNVNQRMRPGDRPGAVAAGPVVTIALEKTSPPSSA